MLGLVSCSNEDIPTPAGDGDGNVMITVKLPEEMSRAFSDGLSAKNLHYAVYNHGETTPIISEEVENAFNNLTATVKCQLVNTKTYDIIFWADAPDNEIYTFDADTQSITVDYTAAGKKGVNNENADAFFANTTVTVSAPFEASVVLKRPLAQVNLGTTDWNSPAVQGGSLTNVQTNFTTTAYQGLNLMTGEVSDQVTVAFAKGAAVDNDAETFPVADRNDIYYLSMDYILVEQDHAIQDGKFQIYNGSTLLNTVDVPNMPVQRNYRTNIFGNLLTSQMTVNVTIDPMYDGNFEVEIPRWDGKSVALEADADGNYHVTLPGHLAYIAELVNQGNSLANNKIVLDNDIDLYNHQWSPIGVDKKSFKGTFDGQNHTIKNLSIHSEMLYAGLFGLTENGKVSNLTLENVHISNPSANASSGTGAICGCPYTTTYSNITVTGEIQISGFRYVGGMFGHNMYSRSSNLHVIVPDQDKPYSWVKATNAYWGWLQVPNHVGGIVGYMGEGNTSLTDCSSNIDVWSSAPGVGGIAGTIQASNTMTNVTCSGNVTLDCNYKSQNGEYAIGGLAGGYLGTVTFNQCSFTGTLKSICKGTEVTLEAINDYCGVKYGGKMTGYSNTHTGVTVNN